MYSVRICTVNGLFCRDRIIDQLYEHGHNPLPIRSWYLVTLLYFFHSSLHRHTACCFANLATAWCPKLSRGPWEWLITLVHSKGYFGLVSMWGLLVPLARGSQSPLKCSCRGFVLMQFTLGCTPHGAHTTITLMCTFSINLLSFFWFWHNAH